MRKIISLSLFIVVISLTFASSIQAETRVVYREKYIREAPCCPQEIVVVEKHHYPRRHHHCHYSCCTCCTYPEGRYYRNYYYPEVRGGWNVNFGFGGRW